MLYAMQKITGQCAHVLRAIGQILIHTYDVNNMNVWLIQSAPQLLHARMKSVLILASAQDMPIVLLEIIEEYAHASQVTLATHMALLVHLVSLLFP